MWFHLEPKGQGYHGARVGVAVADQPTGPYRFVDSFRPNAGVWPLNILPEARRPLNESEQTELARHHFNGGPEPDFPLDLIFRRDIEGGQMSRDMTLFVDDDGSAYQIYASEENATLQISQLRPDFLAPLGKYIRIFPGGFNEAPAMFKCDGKYYLITSGCTGWEPNAARLFVADSILGSWTSLGNPCHGKDADKTFGCQSAFVLSDGGCLICLFDRWNSENASDGRYVWLPVEITKGFPSISWHDQWSLK